MPLFVSIFLAALFGSAVTAASADENVIWGE